MKTKISRIGKKSLSIVIALIMIVSTMLVGMVSVNAASETFVAKSKIYIDIGSTWYSSVTDTNVNATIYAKYCYSDGSSDINNPVSTEKLTQVSESIYTGTIPDNAFIRCIKVERRNSDGTTTWNSFNALGSKRSDDGNNLATFTNTGADWSVGTVTWSTYSGGSTSHSISKGAETNGTFSVSATSATAGSTVTVTTFPATGYEVDKVTYTANGSTQDASGSNNTYTFKMPAANVTVNVTFKQSTTPSATYYLTGRFGIKNDDGTMTYLAGSLNGWVDGITSNIKFTQVPGSTLYKLETGLTIKDLATNTGDSTWYFQISDGTNKYRPDSGADKAITIDDKNSNFGTGTSGGSFYFTGNDETGNVTLYFDTNGNKFYFEVGGSTPTTEDGAFTIEDKSEGHGTLSFTSSGENRTPGTANAGETVTVTAKPEASYFSCDSVAVTYETTSKEKVTITSSAIQNNSCTFVVPADLTAASVKDAEISVKATFTLDKPAYIQSLGNGLWIDVDPDHNDTTATLIKWNNYKGSNHSTTSNYTFYVSKNVDLTNAKVYNGFDSDVTLNGVNIPANNCNTSQLNLSNTTTTYTTSGATSASVKVMQGSTDSMFLYTTKSGTAYNLPTQIGAGAKKGDVKTDGGVCKTISNTGSYSKVMNLESVKGRGNSSWQASHEVFGKYAYNMKLSSKTNLLGMDSAESKGAKSWCLLANNADESMLAGTNSDFKSVIRKVWEQPGGFFETIQTYCGSNSKIDSWYDDIKDSVAMNEYRWGFIANDPISSWGSTDNGDTHLDAVNYLENTWVAQRAAWLDTQFTNDTEYAPFTPATPTIKAFKADGKTEIAEEFTGTDFIIKVTSNIESGVKYRLYEGSSSEYLENADGVFTLNVTEAGEKTYTVKAVCGNLESQASAPVTITIITAVDISGVRLTTLKTEVSVNETFTLTAEVAPVGLSGVTYTYYMNNAPINGATDITSNTYQVRIASAGSATFKVAATANGKTVTSSSVTVTATKVDNVHNLKVYFKCPSAPAYKPSVSIDGKAPVAMTQGTELGKNYSGTLTFYWYYADLGEINSADVHTVTFTSKRTKLNATMEDIFADTEYYLAVDDLMSGTEVVDLTEFSGDAEKEHILNFYHSATNTVYSGVGTDKTLGFTNIGGTRYKMGTLVDNNGVATFSIRSATAMQMLSAQLTTVSKTQQALLDVNLDGRVDVKDATLMQRALVS